MAAAKAASSATNSSACLENCGRSLAPSCSNPVRLNRWRQGPSCPAGRGKIAGPGPRNSERRAPAGKRLSGRGETGWLARTQGGREPQRGSMPREDSRPTEDNARRPVSPRPAPSPPELAADAGGGLRRPRRYFRRMVTDSISKCPDYDNGEYKAPPVCMPGAFYALAVMTSSPKDMQRQMPTKEKADAGFDRMIARDLKNYDANDMLYQFAASSDYDPAPELGKIQCYLMAVNSADDQ